MKETNQSSLATLHENFLRYWSFVLFTLSIPLGLNIGALVIYELKYEIVSYYYDYHNSLGIKPILDWRIFIAKILFVLLILTLVGIFASFLLNRLGSKDIHRTLMLFSATITIGTTALIYSFGTQVIDSIWFLTFYKGYGFIDLTSSFSRITAIITFTAISIVYIAHFMNRNGGTLNDEQPNPRST